MLQEPIEPAWLNGFESVLGRCALQKGDTVAVPSESQSRPALRQMWLDLLRWTAAKIRGDTAAAR